MRVFFDTNILVYLYDADAPEKQERAREVFESEASAGHALLSTQVLQEFYVTVTRKLGTPMDAENAEQVVKHLTALPIVQIDAEIVLAAIGRSRGLQLSFWDALIVEAALAGGAHRLITEDLQHGRVIDGLSIENPFA